MTQWRCGRDEAASRRKSGGTPDALIVRMIFVTDARRLIGPTTCPFAHAQFSESELPGSRAVQVCHDLQCVWFFKSSFTLLILSQIHLFDDD